MEIHEIKQTVHAIQEIWDCACNWVYNGVDPDDIGDNSAWDRVRPIMLAAPELLEACRAMTAIVGRLACINNSDVLEWRQYQDALAAISKAEGQQ